MILSYGFSITGLKHRSSDKPCQDAHCIRLFSNGWAAAAVADGLGSSARADEAARLAVAVFNELDESELPAVWDPDAACALLKTCFQRALLSIKLAAAEENSGQNDHNTTLTAVLFDGKNVAYGHCGDSGIIGLTTGGEYRIITQAQKGEEFNSVIPLNFGSEYWIFDSAEEEFCSLLLMTDGLFDVATPSLLADDEKTGGVYIRFVRQFMDASVLGMTRENAAKTEEAVNAFFDEGPSPDVTDDKTLVCLIREGFTPLVKEEAYYAEPDWAALRETKHKKLYGQTDSEGEESNDDVL